MTISHFSYFKLTSMLLLMFCGTAQGQTDLRPLLKVGGFAYFTRSEFSAYSAHIELEKAWKNNAYLTMGPRIDYLFIKYLPGNIYSGDLGGKLHIGYQLKLYPFCCKSGIPYQGIFIGIEPLFLLKRPGDDFFRYGPGLGTLAGYQYIFKERFSLGFEASMIYFQNINESRPPKNPEDRYFEFYACIKVGVKLGNATGTGNAKGEN